MELVSYPYLTVGSLRNAIKDAGWSHPNDRPLVIIVESYLVEGYCRIVSGATHLEIDTNVAPRLVLCADQSREDFELIKTNEFIDSLERLSGEMQILVRIRIHIDADDADDEDATQKIECEVVPTSAIVRPRDGGRFADSYDRLLLNFGERFSMGEESDGT
jgi:hypothetical protein